MKKGKIAKKKFVKEKSGCFGCRHPSNKNKESKVRKLVRLSKSKKHSKTKRRKR